MEIEKAIERLKRGIEDIMFSTLYSQEQEEEDIRTVLKELEKKDKIIENAKDRIEYYLMGNSTLNDFNVREKELERLLKVLNKAEESE